MAPLSRVGVSNRSAPFALRIGRTTQVQNYCSRPVFALPQFASSGSHCSGKTKLNKSTGQRHFSSSWSGGSDKDDGCSKGGKPKENDSSECGGNSEHGAKRQEHDFRSTVAEGSESEAFDQTAPVPLTKGGGGLAGGGQVPLEPELIALPLQSRPLFPGQQQLLSITHPDALERLRQDRSNRVPHLAVFLRKGTASSGDHAADAASGQHAEDLSSLNALDVLHRVGTRARIVQAAPLPGVDGEIVGIQVLLRGLDLIRLEKVLSPGPPLVVQASRCLPAKADEQAEEYTTQVKAYINESMQTIREIMKINAHFRDHAALIHQGFQLESGSAQDIAHFACSLTTAEGPELMEVLESDDQLEKLRLALSLLKKELDMSQLQKKISLQIEEKVSATQREFFLREQMKSIKKELGEDKGDGSEELLEKFKQRLQGKTLPKEANEVIGAELEKLAGLSKQSQDYQITQNYLDWLTSLPWGIHSEDTLSLEKARDILDRDHYGLQDVKQRILEIIAVGALRGSVQGKIVCMVGPPGVGKTSIGKSIAAALGREFYRFSVGGLYDVAEIKGHRRTYVGAMPGKMTQCLKKTQTENPLVLIDEVDKIGRGHQGDPASALLELLDPSQNQSFMDHYLDVPVDASKVLFICTANQLDTIPGPLLDRMEVIRLSGYDLPEKVQIAEKYLIPNIMREVGLWPAKDEADSEPQVEGAYPTEKIPAVAIPDQRASIKTEAVEALIRWYCREAGVRNLQKHIEKLCRKLAMRVVEHGERGSSATCSEADLSVTEAKLAELVGKPVFTSDRMYDGDLPKGTVTGLAWTSMGGTVLYTEAVALPRVGGAASSAPSLSVTGQLGSVMKESSQIALLVARKKWAELKRSPFFEEHELHLHCPEGATPKDGPSAGVTMVTSLLSLGLDRPARSDLAMTGEISLNGRVLPVGGIKEKIIAARRAGCRAVALPLGNRRDFDELPEYLKSDLEVTFAAEYSDVFNVAFPGFHEGAPADLSPKHE